MKRFFILTLLSAILLNLCACSKIPTVQNDFTAAFTTQEDGIAYAGTLCKSEDSLTITMSAPYTVQGMSFVYEGTALHIRYGDHSTDANADYLSDTGVPSVLHNTLAYLSQATYTADDNGEDSFTLPTPYGDAVLTAKDGKPTSLTDAHSGVVFRFE